MDGDKRMNQLNTHETLCPGNQLNSKLYLSRPKAVWSAAAGVCPPGSVWFLNVPVSQAV
jgi:hypothetical protein